MKSKKKDRSGFSRTTPVNKKENNLPLDTKVLKERAPVKGKDIAALVLALMWSKDKEGKWSEMVGIPTGDSH